MNKNVEQDRSVADQPESAEPEIMESASNLEKSAEESVDGVSSETVPSSEAGPTEGTSNEISGLMKKLDEVTAELNDYRARFLRSVADFENYRRRMTREKDEVRLRAAAEVVEDLLPVIDTLELGLDSARKHHPEARAVLDGIEMVQTQARSVLEQHGLQRIDPIGAQFDPNVHEAVAHQPSDAHEEGMVCAVVRPGYKLRDRLLRPATVMVSSGTTSQRNDSATGAAEPEQPQDPVE